MIQEFIKIEVGTLLLVTKGFWTSGQKSDGGFDCKRFMPKGEILEIRYPYEWHFRTASNVYDHSPPEKIKSNCEFYGKIHSDIRFQNEHKLKDILSEKLYHSPEEYQMILKPLIPRK